MTTTATMTTSDIGPRGAPFADADADAGIDEAMRHLRGVADIFDRLCQASTGSTASLGVIDASFCIHRAIVSLAADAEPWL
jgi:hypothetical protein